MKNYRQYDAINEGKPFPFNYDRRHNLKLVLQYKISKDLFINSVFMYGSGYPFNLPIIQQNYIDITEGEQGLSENFFFLATDAYYASAYNNNNVTYTFNSINSYRLPDYHRLDISVNWRKQKKLGIRTWALNIYNVYNHKNPYLLYLSYDDNKNLQLYQFTLFPIIPSISYSLKF